MSPAVSCVCHLILWFDECSEREKKRVRDWDLFFLLEYSTKKDTDKTSKTIKALNSGTSFHEYYIIECFFLFFLFFKFQSAWAPKMTTEQFWQSFKGKMTFSLENNKYSPTN